MTINLELWPNQAGGGGGPSSYGNPACRVNEIGKDNRRGYPPWRVTLPEKIRCGKGFTGSFHAPWSAVTLDHWSWSRSFQKNAPKGKDHVHILDMSCQRKAVHVQFRWKIQQFIGFSNIREVETVYNLEVIYAKMFFTCSFTGCHTTSRYIMSPSFKCFGIHWIKKEYLFPYVVFTLYFWMIKLPFHAFFPF